MRRHIETLVGGAALLGSAWAAISSFNSLLTVSIKIDDRTTQELKRDIEGRQKFVFCDDFFPEEILPSNLSALIKLDNCIVYINSTTIKTNTYCKITDTFVKCFRADKDKVLKYLSALDKGKIREGRVSVELYSTNDTYGTHLGYLKKVHEPYLEKDKYAEIVEDVRKCADQEIDKTGIILYGPPGNGKTSFIKYLGIKYKLAIKFVVVTPQMTNADITKMFSRFGDKCIVVFEDFDRLKFEKRAEFNTCEGPSMDSLLSGFDGIYNNYNGVVFVITANVESIDKIDEALNRRPSRFKHKLKIESPSEEIRNFIFNGNKELIEKTKDMNLDEVLTLRDKLDHKSQHPGNNTVTK